MYGNVCFGESFMEDGARDTDLYTIKMDSLWYDACQTDTVERMW